MIANCWIVNRHASCYINQSNQIKNCQNGQSRIWDVYVNVFAQLKWINTVDGRNPGPIDMENPPLFTRFLCISNGWPWDFWTINSMELEFQQILRIVSRVTLHALLLPPFGILFPHLKGKHRSFVPWQGRGARFPKFLENPRSLVQSASFENTVYIYIYIYQCTAKNMLQNRRPKSS